MEILNKTKRPLRVPLPGGKKLHLGPGRTGQITPKAAQHPPLQKLVEAGEIELVDVGKSGKGGAGGGGPGVKSSQRDPSSGGVRHTGDR